MSKYRWAILGIGAFSPKRGGANAIAYAHAEAIKRNSDTFELVAGAARTQQNLDDFSREYPCRTYQDLYELLKKEKPDGVTVSTYASDRKNHVLAAIHEGVRFILIEKPLSLSMREAEEIKCEAEKYGARLFVTFQRRYGMPFEWVRTLCLSGKLGRISLLEMRQPCSNLLDFGPHFINSALYFTDDPEPLSVMAVQENADSIPWHGILTEKYMESVIEFKNGMRIVFSGSPDLSIDIPSIRICGDKGAAELYMDKLPGMNSIFRCLTENGWENPESTENFHHGDQDKYLYFERCFRDLGECIKHDLPCRIDLKHGYLTQRILLGIYASAQQNRKIIFNKNEIDPVFSLQNLS